MPQNWVRVGDTSELSHVGRPDRADEDPHEHGAPQGAGRGRRGRQPAGEAPQTQVGGRDQ